MVKILSVFSIVMTMGLGPLAMGQQQAPSDAYAICTNSVYSKYADRLILEFKLSESGASVVKAMDIGQLSLVLEKAGVDLNVVATEAITTCASLQIVHEMGVIRPKIE